MIILQQAMEMKKMEIDERYNVSPFLIFPYLMPVNGVPFLLYVRFVISLN